MIRPISVILAAVLLIMGFVSYSLAVLADLIAVNRQLIEEQSYRLKQIELPNRDSAHTHISGVRLYSHEAAE